MTETSTASVDLSRIVKAYDIRGVAFEEFTVEAARALGAAFADLLDAGDLVVAHDMRVSSPALAEAFADGALTRGSTVAFAGLSSTDQLYCASGLFHAAGAQFTASHNPAPDNGIKMCFPGARPVGRDSGLLEVRDGAQRYLEAGHIEVREGGRLESVDTLADYISTVSALVPVPSTRPLRVVVDAANAMAGHTVPALAERLENIEIIPLYFELDGTFPNHEANPLDPANLRDLQQAVREHVADLGLAFDGDADRCIVVDERAEIVPPSAITAMIAEAEIARARAAGEEEPAVVANLVSSRIVAQTIEAAGGRHIRSRVGHSLIKAIMADNNAVFGGEHSAHFYFRDFYFADSGMLAALHVLRALASTDLPLSALVARFNPYAASGEINSVVDSVDEATARVLAHVASLSAIETDTLDGLTLTHWDESMEPSERWWVSLRPSNTEPLLRLNVEAEEEGTMVRVRDELLGLIRADADADGEAATEAAAVGSGVDKTAATVAAGEPAFADVGAAESSPVPAWVEDLLACPVCHGCLRMDSREARCDGCGARYEVSEGIPVLIPAAADQSSESADG